ncbi:MAG: hypothetical protein JWQ49_4986 [Edaphobacter sp.]|nr:hypothetical protein [Edaphobacter sp.]
MGRGSPQDCPFSFPVSVCTSSTHLTLLFQPHASRAIDRRAIHRKQFDQLSYGYKGNGGLRLQQRGKNAFGGTGANPEHVLDPDASRCDRRQRQYSRRYIECEDQLQVRPSGRAEFQACRRAWLQRKTLASKTARSFGKELPANGLAGKFRVCCSAFGQASDLGICVVQDKHYLKSVHQEIDLYDRKLAHLNRYDVFASDADRDLRGADAGATQTALRRPAHQVGHNPF